MSVLPPIEHQYLFGHDAIASRLKKSFDENRLHHALILYGLNGIGKETLAWQLIRYALAFPNGNKEDTMRVPENSTTAKQITAKSHPHVFTIQPVFDEKKQRFKRDITLEALDGLNNFLRLSTIDDAPRFILINPADSMNRNTQNALLKLLEEPPAKTHFILLTTQIGTLLPTIRSRCLALPIESLSMNDFSKTLITLMPAIDDAKIPGLFHLSSGAPGQAIQNEELELLENYGELCRAVIAWHEDSDTQQAMRFAETLSRDEVLSAVLIETLLARLALLLKTLVTSQSLTPVIPEEQHMLDLLAHRPQSVLLALHDMIRDTWNAGEFAYLDRKLVLMQIISALSGIDKENRSMLA